MGTLLFMGITLVSHYSAGLCNMCLGIGSITQTQPFQSTVVTPSCYSFEDMTQLTACQKRDKLIQMLLLDLLWPFLGPLMLQNTYTA